MPILGASGIHRPAYRAFCDLLRSMRERSGMTQREVAQRLGKPHSFVHKSEIGERRLDVLEFVELCRAMDLDPPTVLARVDTEVRRRSRR